jgi:hypothetical protein
MGWRCTLREGISVGELDNKQQLSLKHYKAYGELCSTVDAAKGFHHQELEELRVIRGILHMMYKRYDPDNSFDVSIGVNDDKVCALDWVHDVVLDDCGTVEEVRQRLVIETVRLLGR